METMEKETPSQQKTFSPEEMKKMRDAQKLNFEEEIAYLEPMVKYHELLARYQVAQHNELQAQIAMAQLSAQIQQNQTDYEKEQKRNGVDNGSPKLKEDV